MRKSDFKYDFPTLCYLASICITEAWGESHCTFCCREWVRTYQNQETLDILVYILKFSEINGGYFCFTFNQMYYIHQERSPLYTLYLNTQRCPLHSKPDKGFFSFFEKIKIEVFILFKHKFHIFSGRCHCHQYFRRHRMTALLLLVGCQHHSVLYLSLASKPFL